MSLQSVSIKARCRSLVHLGLVLGGLSLAATTPAQSTAFAGVQEAFWRVNSLVSFPSGVSFSCFGDAIAIGAYGCGSTGSLTITNDTADEITKTLSLIGGFKITNNTDAAIEHVAFTTIYSAFNSGGSEIGGSVNDPLLEYAAFRSSVSGPGVQDQAHCDTITGPFIVNGFTVINGLTACGVSLPDHGTDMDLIGTIGVGETVTQTYQINISATARGLPEPTTVALFLAGILGMLSISRVNIRTFNLRNRK